MSRVRRLLRRLDRRYLGGYPPVPRLVQLHRLAYQEAGLPAPRLDGRVVPFVAKYPQSWVDRVAELPDRKIHDFNFVGAFFFPATQRNRGWIVDFARAHFTGRSYLSITDPPSGYQPIGPYDHTLDDLGKRFVPRSQGTAEKSEFDEGYFRTIRESQFTLCPAGDSPWSMRFYESVMCRSIPILERREHAGRNALERAIGYRFYLVGDRLEFREDWVAENYAKFLRRQTLLGRRVARA